MSPERVPFGEDHQGDSDEAAARGHAFIPGPRQRHGEMRAADAAEKSRQRERLILQ